MSSFGTHSVILGICPDNFRADRTFHFIQAVAELFDNRWMRISKSSVSRFQPSGDFFAPPEHCVDLGPNDIASWEVEDQSDWSIRKLSTRYRSIRRADSPIEIVPARVGSSSLNSRDVLCNDGLAVVVGRTDALALVEFSDGVVAKLRLQSHPTKPGWSVPIVGDLSNPVDAWPSAKSFQVITFSPNGKQRRFVTDAEIGDAPQCLDLATLDEIIITATRPGGFGSYSGPSPNELKKSREKLHEVLKAFPPGKWEARWKRFEQFLADSEQAEASKELLATYFAGHPTFHQVVKSHAAEITNQLTESLRIEIRASEAEVIQRIQDKEKELSEVAEMVRQETAQQENLASKVQVLRLEKGNLEAEVSKLRQECDTPHVPMVQGLQSRTQWFSASSETNIPKTEALISLIEKNLSAIGINTLSARQLGYEVVAAASLGQVAFFRGSLARPVAEAVGISLAGESLRTVRVTLGTVDTLPIDLEPSNFSQAVLILGANLACLDTYGEEIKRTVFQRRLFPHCHRLPVFLATLEDGASSLPIKSGVVDLGPVLDTDVLPWKLPTKEPVLFRGKFDAAVLQVPDGETDRDFWDGVLKNTGSTTGLWPGLAVSVLKRLAGLASFAKGTQPGLSFLFGWLLPRLLANGSPLDDYKEAILTALTSGTKPFDPRVLAILKANQVEGSE